MKVEVVVKPEFSEPIARISTNKITARIEMAKNLLENEEFSSKIPVYQGKKLILLEQNKIQLIRTELGNVIVYMEDGSWYEVRETLQYLENTLGEQFIRISKGSLINMDCIKSVKASFNGTMEVLLDNDLEDIISRNYRKLFKERLGVK
ncbi:LytR/AlgR family response regulator transcription factor [Solibacillus silvestris]|uniref:LytR/AlgR family response regulator transcription factor n=1 Tax=Solibacillus silvestris TaxID=76853 RepID=UPI003F803135